MAADEADGALARPAEPSANADDEKKHGRLWNFFVDKGMPLLTAILTVLAAALGVWGVNESNDKDELADTVDSLEETRNALKEDKETLEADLVDLAESRDDWKRRAEAAESAADDSPDTSLGTTGNSPTPGDVSPEPAGVFRQTGNAPVTLPRTTASISTRGM